jgi:hypothetical protein
VIANHTTSTGNSILQSREQDLYVDYVEAEDGTCEWQDPDYFEKLLFLSSRPRTFASDLVGALSTAGLHRAPALEVVASHWRTVAPTPDTHVTEIRDRTRATLQALQDKGLLQGESSIWSDIIARWTFPLWAVDTSEQEVKKSDLQQERDGYIGSWD